MISAEILQYLEEAAPEGTAHLQVRLLEGATGMDCTVELDRPNVEVKGPEGNMLARLHVPTGEFKVNLPGVEQPWEATVAGDTVTSDDDMDYLNMERHGVRVSCVHLPTATAWIFVPPQMVEIDENDGVPFVGELAEFDGVVCYKFSLETEDGQQQSAMMAEALINIINQQHEAGDL